MKFELSQIENNGNRAIMRLNRPISSDPAKGITGDMFTKEHDALVDAGVTDLLVTINSTGGNTFQGWEIFSTIAGSPMNTETQVVGVSASMAGVISQAGNKRSIKSNALFHAHSPRPEKGAKVGAGVLMQVYNQIKTVFVENTVLDENGVDGILDGETFFDAVTAKENGLFDEIIPTTGRVPEFDKTMNAHDIMDVVNAFENTPDPAVSGTIQKNGKMSQINELLKLSADANESSTIEAIQNLQTSVADLESKNAGLIQEVENANKAVEKLQGENQAMKTAKVEQIIANAIDAGKIEADNADVWKAMEIDQLENLLATIPSKPANAKAPEIVSTENKIDNVENASWNFEQWSQNDPAGLEKMRVENNAKFTKLFNEHYA